MRIDRLLEEQQSLRQTHEVELARQRLKTLLGFALTDLDIEPVASASESDFAFDTDELVSRALDSRPDLWAAGFNVRAAERRAHLAHYDWFQFSGLLPDANGKGQKGFEAGPGMNFTVPLFHQNQAAIARTRAEAEQARRRCETLRNQVALEVRQACIRVSQAQESLRFCQDQLVPECQQAIVTSEKAYRARAASLLLLLENNRQLLTSQAARGRSVGGTNSGRLRNWSVAWGNELSSLRRRSVCHDEIVPSRCLLSDGGVQFRQAASPAANQWRPRRRRLR